MNDPLIQSALREFREKFATQEMCKACQLAKCDHSTTGCPWYTKGIILNPNGGWVDGADQIEAWLSSTFQALLRAREERIREDNTRPLTATELRLMETQIEHAKNAVESIRREERERIREAVEKMMPDERKLKTYGNEWEADSYEDVMLVRAVLSDILAILSPKQEP